ncbi:caspase family protein [Actinoplanes sp. KI2]|uniref:caspase, EACC1-associated type n=1 Tax=Actinoplanes sp. KI2 TaxID=2983315 RepID=UPI0021D5D3F4|nr:caspase family protein [Actinoplanes sp. KI2]MCU7726371.1 caspase family protein [Actinoplanes sp. KI2]
MTDLAGPGARALVIGTARHTGPTLPPVPAAAASARAFAATLTEVCAMAPGSVRLLLDPPQARDMAEAVAEAAGDAESVLLLYFAGHGLLDESGELHLAAAGTDRLTPGLSDHQALAYSAVRKALAGCRAPAVVLILDCCYSGRARTPGAAGPVGPGYTPPPVHGAYVLASAENLATAPPEAELTTFTGELVALLTDGDQRAGRLLTLDVVHERLLSRLRAAGAPLPRRQSGDTSGSLVLAVNRATPERTPDAEPPAEGICPWPGLAPYGAEDARLYFGRDELTGKLVTAAAEAGADGRPLLVVGASGSGKSSLVQAGLLAAVHRPAAVLTPGEHPLDALPRAAPGSIVVVDQFEQLFTLCHAAAEQTEFLAALTRLAADHLVVLALRADFYAQAAERPQLRAALDHQFLVTPMTPAELRAAIEGPASVAGLRLEGALADVLLHELGAGNRLPLLSHALWATWRNRSGNTLTERGYDAAGRIDRAVATSAEEVYEGLDDAARSAARRLLPRLVQVGEENPDTVRPAARDELLHALPEPDAGRRALEAFTAARLITQDRDTVRLGHEALLRVWPRLVGWLDEDRDWLRTSQRLAADAEAWRKAGRDPALAYRGSRLAAAREGARSRADVPPVSAEFLAASEGLARRAARRLRAGIATLAVLLLVAVAGAAVAVKSRQEALAQRREALAQQEAAEAARNRALSRAISADAARIRNDQPGLAKQLAAVAYRMDPAEGTQALLNSPGVPGQLATAYPAFDLAENAAGNLLALATGQALILWDATTSSPLSRIDSLFTGPVAVSPDGTLLAAAVGPLSGADPTTAGKPQIEQPRPTVRLWSIADPRRPLPLPDLPTDTASITTLAFSPDGRLLAAAGTGGRIHLWDVGQPAPRKLPDLTGHRGRVDSVTFAPAGHLLAGSGTDGTVRLWDLTDPARPAARARLTGSTVALSSEVRMIQHRVAFDPTGRRLAFVVKHHTNESPALYDVSDPRRPKPVFQQPADDDCERVYGMLLTADTLVTSCELGYVQTWVRGRSLDPRTAGQSMLRTAKRMPTTTGGALRTGAVLARPEVDGRRTVAVASTSGVFLWDVTDPSTSGGLVTTVDGPNGFLIRVQFNPAGPRLMAEASGRDGARLLDVADPADPHLVGTITSTPPNDLYHQEAGGGLAFRPDGAVVAATKMVNHRPHVLLLSTSAPGGPPLGEITTGLEYGAAALSFSADGKLIAVADHERGPRATPPSVKIFDVGDPAHPRLMSSIPRALTWDLAFSPTSRLLAVFTANEIVLRDLADPAHPRELPSYRFPAGTDLPNGVFTPDGKTLIVSANTRLIRILPIGADGLTDPPPGSPTEFTGQALNGSRSLAISPDGHLLAVLGNEDAHQVDLWDVSKPYLPRLQTSLDVTDVSPLDAVAFSADGRFLAVKDGEEVGMWSIDPDVSVRTLCRLAGDPITRQQWALYVGEQPAYHPPCP